MTGGDSKQELEVVKAHVDIFDDLDGGGGIVRNIW
jgi:hypothetical protein